MYLYSKFFHCFPPFRLYCSFKEEWSSLKLRLSNKTRSSLSRSTTLRTIKQWKHDILWNCYPFMFMCLSPQIELILAVGLKLSTKSDIKLPRSYKHRPNETERTRLAGTKDQREIYYCWIQMTRLDTHTHKKTHTNPVWQLSLWVQFPDFCDGKIGWQEASVSVQHILYDLEDTE